MDLVGLWSRVLTADERTENYNAGAAIAHPFTDNGEGFRKDLVAYYKMEETSGPRVNAAAADALKRGLIHRWSLDEESGTREDSISGAHLTDVNTVGFAAGKDGNAASFTQASQEGLTLTGQDFSGDFGVSFWFQKGVINDNLWHTLFFIGDAWTANTLLHVDSYNVGTRVYTGDGGSIAGGNGPNVGLDTWVHLAAWRSGSTLYWSFDGAAPSSAAIAGALHSSTKLTVGMEPAGGTWTTGKVDELLVYNRALSTAEAAALYAAGAGTFYPYADASVYDLTDVNTVTSAAGVSGNAAHFVRANNEGLTGSRYPQAGDDEWTLAAWLKVHEVSPDRYVRTVSVGEGYLNLYTYLQAGRLVLVQLWCADAAGWGGASHGWGDLGDHTDWHHIGCTYSLASGQMVAYLNGVPSVSATPATGMTWNMANGDEIRVGHNGGGTDSSGADIDEVVIARRAWSATEMAALYAAGGGRFYDFNTL